MEIDPVLVLFLLAADDELVVLDLDREIVHGETGDRERDAQRILADLLDIIGGIAVGRGLGDAVERTLEMVEAQQQRRIEQRQTGQRTSSDELSPKRGPAWASPDIQAALAAPPFDNNVGGGPGAIK